METIENLGLFQKGLKSSDIPGAMALVREAGWNQVPADWEWMCAVGDAIVLKDADGRIVASALALPYGLEFGWISMVLVSKDMRRKGLATFLLDDRISWLKSRNLTPILDATADGEKVYRNIGFEGDLTFTRWQGIGVQSGAMATQIRQVDSSDYEEIYKLDAECFCADRRSLISNLIEREKSAALVCETVERGFAIVRQGSNATQIGPLVASDQSDAIALIEAALVQCDGPVFFDLLDQRVSIANHITALGFEKQRSFKRMSLGKAPLFSDHGTSFIVAGPEYG